MTGDSATAPTPKAGRDRATGGRVDLWATRLLIVYFVVALPLVLFVLGSYHWFFGDEWEFLVDRSVQPDDLVRHHFGHWVTTPILVYRALFAVFGIRSYLPYQTVLVVSHLVGAWLLFVVMRRADVRAWLAACVVAPFVLFGPGAQNLVWAFQIAFNFALVLGLAQLLLADHEGPIDRRDWLGLGAGALALTCSGVAPAMILAVGVATWIRRGIRPAMFHTVPLAVLYLTWYLLAEPVTRRDPFSPARLLDWVVDGEVAAFEGLGHWSLLAVGFAVLLVVGFTLVWRSSSRSVRRRRLAAPLALVIGGLAFEAAVGTTRISGIGQGAASSRYVYVAAALALPALAVAAEAVSERWRPLGLVVAGLFVLPIIPNLHGFDGGSVFNKAFFDHRRELFVAMAHSPYVDRAPDWLQPDPGLFKFQSMDVEFLRSARSDGRLPGHPDRVDPVLESQMPLVLGLARVDEPPDGRSRCTTHRMPLQVEPEVGDTLTLGSAMNIAPGGEVVGAVRPLTFRPADGAIEVVVPGLELVLTPAGGQTEFVLCGLDA